MKDKNCKAKILIADDQEELTDMLESYFLQKAYSVDTASNGNEAIEKLLSFHPDILLLDLKMPDMDGEEVLRYVQANNIKISVIIMTGYPGYIKDRKLLGRTYDYIVKPFDLDYLNRVVMTKVVLLSDPEGNTHNNDA